MKLFGTSILLVFVLPSLAKAGLIYGFLNQDVAYNSCFVGIPMEGSNLSTYSQSLPNRFFFKEQRDLMHECNDSKMAGQPMVIEVETIPDTQTNPDGITTHFPKFKVNCVEMKVDAFGDFLNFWRSTVRQSNFRRCM